MKTRKRKFGVHDQTTLVSPATMDAKQVGLSEYELRRLENIKENEEMLRQLGLSLNSLTVSATGKLAPSQVIILHCFL